MTEELPSPESREELYLAKAAGESVEVPTPESRKELFLNAIAQGGGGGGGSYSAGTGIDITSNVISVDTNTIQAKLTAGTGIDITGNTISATGGGGDTVYSNKNTSNSNTGGAVYIGNLDATQAEQADPTTTDNHYKYFWALPTDNTTKPLEYDVCILGSVSSAGGERISIGHDADAFAESIAIGHAAKATSANAVVLGHSAGVSRENTVAIGYKAKAGSSGSIAMGAQATSGYSGSVAIGLYSTSRSNQSIHIGAGGTGYGIDDTYSDGSICIGNRTSIVEIPYSVALGEGAKATRQGEVNIGAVDPNSDTHGYNNTSYRVIGGVHDGQLAHDAATVGQINATIDAINTALSTSIPHVGA